MRGLWLIPIVQQAIQHAISIHEGIHEGGESIHQGVGLILQGANSIVGSFILEDERVVVATHPYYLPGWGQYLGQMVMTLGWDSRTNVFFLSNGQLTLGWPF